MDQTFDAVVVGAGPAGCACGHTLAQAGLNTLVIERGKYAGSKNMWGGALYGPALQHLVPRFWEEAPVERYIQRHRLSLLTAEAATTTEFSSVKFGRPPYNGFSVLRSRFDRWFAAKAEQAGAIVATGLKAEDLLWDGRRVAGVRAGGDELPARVVIACDGVNSDLVEKAGLRGKLSPRDLKQGVKEVLQVPRSLLEQRFNLSGEEGLAWEFIGTFTRGLPGGAFLYTNKDSLSVGVIVQLNALAEHKQTANDLLEEFKQHPELARYLEGGKLVEYSAHLIPASGRAMVPRLFRDGFLAAGDAAALTLAAGWVMEGANFAVASGIAAAETVIAAKQAGDFSEKFLSLYDKRLKQNFVLQDLETFRKAPRFLENPRLYLEYPEMICGLAEKIYTNDGRPRKKLYQLLKEARRNRVSSARLLQDLWGVIKAL